MAIRPHKRLDLCCYSLLSRVQLAAYHHLPVYGVATCPLKNALPNAKIFAASPAPTNLSLL